jgi:DNA-binding MarR family transcriptional regulator
MTARRSSRPARRRPARLQLEDFLPYRLSVVANVVSQALSAAYAQRFGLSIPEWRVLAVLAQQPGLSAAEVADRTAMDKVAVSRAVAALLRCRRIEREFSTRDRRRSVLRLSAEGVAVYARVVPVARDYERTLVGALSERERNALDRILRVLLGRARELGPAAGAGPDGAGPR